MGGCCNSKILLKLGRLSVTVVIFIMIAPVAQAMHPLISEDAGTQGPGGVLIETNFNYLKDNELKSTAVAVAITAGIGENLDASVEMPYLSLQPSAVTGNSESGPGDVVLKFKHRFLEREKKTGEGDQFESSLAYQVMFSQPTGNEEKGLGAGRSRWGARLISTTEWRSVEFNANLGYESSGQALRRGHFTFDDAVLLSLAAKYDRTRPWEPLVELAVVRTKEGDVISRTANALIGLIYEPSERFYLDAGVRVGLNANSEDYGLLAGFGCKF